MRERILDLFKNHGTLVEPEAADYILSKDDPLAHVNMLLENFEEYPLILTLEDTLKVENMIKARPTSGRETRKGEVASFENNNNNNNIPIETKEIVLPSEYLEASTTIMLRQKTLKIKDEIKPETEIILPESKPPTPMVPVKVRTHKTIIAKEYEPEIKILKDITGNSTSGGKIKDFEQYFNARYKVLKKILRNRREMGNIVPIKRARRLPGQIKIIGMVNNVKITKNGYKILSVEDEDDEATILIPQDNVQLLNVPIVNDEVIGIIGTNSKKGDLIIAENIIRPGIPIRRESKRLSVPVSVAFVSDIHIGSNTFLHSQWERFIQWLQQGVDGAEKIKYMVVTGDVVDGIGIYPGQENDLSITDIYAQYEELARLTNDIPDHIKIIMMPGNHDAVRPAEPQPTFPSDITKLFTKDIEFVGNPCYFSLHNVEILGYHGKSMDDLIAAEPTFDYSKPLRMMTEMLEMRHLAPIYGGKTPIAPEQKDYLLIDRVPDIFVTGHGHATAMGKYHGIILINASAWQSQTSYQMMRNFNPDPAKVPIVDLQTGKCKIMKF